MSAFTWICVFLLVGLLNSPVNGDRDNDNDNDNEGGNGNLGFFRLGENKDNEAEEDDRAIANHPAVGKINYLGAKLGYCLKQKNLPCLLNFYANDVIVVPNGYPSFQGIDQLKKTLTWLNAVTVTKHPATHVVPLGPKGEYVLEVHPFDSVGPTGHTKGKTALIWKQINRQYKIIFEMSNDEY